MNIFNRRCPFIFILSSATLRIIANKTIFLAKKFFQKADKNIPKFSVTLLQSPSISVLPTTHMLLQINQALLRTILNDLVLINHDLHINTILFPVEYNIPITIRQVLQVLQNPIPLVLIQLEPITLLNPTKNQFLRGCHFILHNTLQNPLNSLYRDIRKM
jgi:hypothetical protein